MRHLYKTAEGFVFEYDSEDERLKYGAPDLVKMTELEVNEYLNPAPTPEQEQERINADSRAYLASTDWYVIRLQETGEPIPDETLADRAAARARVIE